MQCTGRQGLRTCTFPMRMLEMSGKSVRVALTASKMDEFCFAVRGVIRPEPMMFRTAAVSANGACSRGFAEPQARPHRCHTIPSTCQLLSAKMRTTPCGCEPHSLKTLTLCQ